MRFLIPLILIPLSFGVCISHFVYDTLGISTVMKWSLLVYVIGYIISVASFTFWGGYDKQKAPTMKARFQWDWGSPLYGLGLLVFLLVLLKIN